MASDELKERWRFEHRRRGDTDTEWCNQGVEWRWQETAIPSVPFIGLGVVNRVDGEGGKWWSTKWIPSMCSLLKSEGGQWKGRGWERKGTTSQSYSKIISNQHHAITILKPFHNHTLYSTEDPRPLVTTSTTIMIVVQFTKISTLYPCVVISSPVGD
jgi:hypothetical protein